MLVTKEDRIMSTEGGGVMEGGGGGGKRMRWGVECKVDTGQAIAINVY